MRAVPTPRRPWALRTALAGYAALLALVLGWPTPVPPVLGALAVVSLQLNEVGASAWAGGSRLEFAANVALFVPFGLLLALVLRGGWWVAAFGGFAFSLVAELAQEVLLPGRSGTVIDVVANTAGAVVGAAIAALVTRRQARTEARPPTAASASAVAGGGA